MRYTLAIEFGGVYTSIYRKEEGLVLKEPSLVCAKQDGEGYTILAMGNEAKKMQGKTDDKTYIFSPFGEGKIKAPEYAVELLNYFLKKVEAKKLIKENAIFCVNSSLNVEERKEYIDVFSKCNIGKILIVPSIICSAEMSGIELNTSRTVCVVNIGGTTTEIALINMNQIIKGASLQLGGRSLDINIANMVADKYETIISIASAQKLKEEIASLYDNDSQSFEVLGADEMTGKPKRVIVTCADVKSVIIPFIEQVVLAIETSINTCAPEIAADIISNGIFISGGVSKIAGIEKYLRKALDIDVKFVEDNENAVILGAGRLLASSSNLQDIANKF